MNKIKLGSKCISILLKKRKDLMLCSFCKNRLIEKAYNKTDYCSSDCALRAKDAIIKQQSERLFSWTVWLEEANKKLEAKDAELKKFSDIIADDNKQIHGLSEDIRNLLEDYGELNATKNKEIAKEAAKDIFDHLEKTDDKTGRYFWFNDITLWMLKKKYGLIKDADKKHLNGGE
jgi:vacuolar-type H+-ATPase subunit I/STV1